MLDLCRAHGLREMTNRGEGLPRRRPFALDNGAFKDQGSGLPFDGEAFLRHVEQVAPLSPDFIVLPDIVAGGLASLELSLSWVLRLRGAAPLYLPLQDGMAEADILPHLATVDGLFVGGGDAWKLSTGAALCAFGRAHGKPVHIGRAGTKKKVAWALRSGATSLDSCFPLWCKQHFWWFMWALSRAQGELFV